ncbi:MAG: NAD(P)-dependent oxidoreductase, partial [Pseudomonadota bacterium]
MKIAVLDDYQGVSTSLADWSALNADVAVFRETISGPPLIERLRPFDVICLMRERTPMPAAVLDALPNLKLLVTTGMRNLSIDVAAARARGVTVCGTNGRGPSTAQLAMTMILAAMRGLIAEAVSMRDGGWQVGLGRDLHGLTLGLIGLGKQGAQMVELAKPFGMNVVAWSQNLTDARCAEVGVDRAALERIATAAPHERQILLSGVVAVQSHFDS